MYFIMSIGFRSKVSSNASISGSYPVCYFDCYVQFCFIFVSQMHFSLVGVFESYLPANHSIHSSNCFWDLFCRIRPTSYTSLWFLCHNFTCRSFLSLFLCLLDQVLGLGPSWFCAPDVTAKYFTLEYDRSHRWFRSHCFRITIFSKTQILRQGHSRETSKWPIVTRQVSCQIFDKSIL